MRARREQGDRVNSLRWIRLVEHHLPASGFLSSSIYLQASCMPEKKLNLASSQTAVEPAAVSK